MFATLKLQPTQSITCRAEMDIHSHITWQGDISGLNAEKLLRGHSTPYLYLLREGEGDRNYYVTFVRPDGTIAHQPFTIGITETGFYCENGAYCIITDETPFADLLYKIMHCNQGECTPFICE